MDRTRLDGSQIFSWLLVALALALLPLVVAFFVAISRASERVPAKAG